MVLRFGYIDFLLLNGGLSIALVLIVGGKALLLAFAAVQATGLLISMCERHRMERLRAEARLAGWVR